MLIKNPKGRIVDVSKEMAEYLLAEKPTKTIEGRAMRNDRGDPVVVVKAAHEKGYTKATPEEIAQYEKQTAKTKAADAQVGADTDAKKADKVQKKADEENEKADASKKAAEELAKKATGTGAPTPDN